VDADHEASVVGQLLQFALAETAPARHSNRRSHIVHPIGHDFAELLILEVVDVNAQWGAFRT
jgi:hypothetical protein